MKTWSTTSFLLMLAASHHYAVTGAEIDLEPHVEGFVFPVEIALDPNDRQDRLFVVEQDGLIKIVLRERNQPPRVLPVPFLDISSKVSFTGGEFEEGLLGLAFHPTESGYFFINYTKRDESNGQGEGANQILTVVSRLKVNDDGLTADPESEVTIMEIEQPKIYHNGGTLVFGPNDGYLYISSGDGGGAGDPGNNAQNLGTRLGKILRIDVDDVDGDPFSFEIPLSNPFVEAVGLDEIWAYGLRNPWKIRFDSKTGDLFIGDVGQSRTEEIDYQPASSAGGENYGWDIVQGDTCNKLGQDCDLSLYVVPILTYPNFGGDCSVTGGPMYRGRDIRDLDGTYMYADFCSGKIWGGTDDGSGVWTSSLLFQAPFLIPTFGEDKYGEVYVSDYYGGAIYKIVELQR